MADTWRKCSWCKNDISVGAKYFVCSVSTCRQKKTDYAFCSVECWDGHIPIERHRGDDIAAIEKTAPNAPGAEPKRRVVTQAGSAIPSFQAKGGTSVDGQVLVVASKVKKYISEKHGLNTSASTMDALTSKIIQICDKAVTNARAHSRKTVMDRDVPDIKW